MNKKKIQAIVAMTSERVIGKPGALPWHIPDDLKRFRKITQGHTVVMGKKTYESIGRPLPNRNNIVLSFLPEEIDGVLVCNSLKEALRKAQDLNNEIFIIGGASIYEQALSEVEILHVSHIKKNYPGTIYFPELNPKDWQETSSEEFPEFVAKTYHRIRAYAFV